MQQNPVMMLFGAQGVDIVVTPTTPVLFIYSDKWAKLGERKQVMLLFSCFIEHPISYCMLGDSSKTKICLGMTQ